MVLEYMRNPRSIMLTVVPANVDMATPEIIDMARDFDNNLGQQELRKGITDQDAAEEEFRLTAP
jgi:hypothetical protein